MYSVQDLLNIASVFCVLFMHAFYDLQNLHRWQRVSCPRLPNHITISPHKCFCVVVLFCCSRLVNIQCMCAGLSVCSDDDKTISFSDSLRAVP